MAQGPAAVEFRTAVTDPIYRNDRKRAELTTFSAEALGTPDVQKSGLTTAHTRLEVVPAFQWLALPDGRTCMLLQSVDVTWRISDLVVDIAAEYRPGTCQYHEVRTHEDEHVRINRDTFAEFVPRMEARLKTVVHDIRPVVTENGPEKAMQAVADRLTRATREVQDAYQAALKARHAVIDTPESYREVSKRCPNW